MSTQTIDLSALAQRRVALVGNPNCGKSSLFNRLTGSQQKVANYAGVTVELKRGLMKTAQGQSVTVLDLPGTYSLNPGAEDEAVACQVVRGQSLQEPAPDLVVAVLDATRLRRSLRLLASLRRLGLPMVVVLNRIDSARAHGLQVDVPRLAQVLGLPLVATVAVQAQGLDTFKALLDQTQVWQASAQPMGTAERNDDAQAQHWMSEAGLESDEPIDVWSMQLDRVLLHPVGGSLTLLVLLFLIFQAVFAGAQAPMDLIKEGVLRLSELLAQQVPTGLLSSLLIDGILAGVGSVLVFLPQILILFFFILVLEESGYLPRAALLLDRMMGSIGLSGRSFIPLLSSFACAIPGIMATRTIANRRDRWVTIMIAPLMTCSARLPVYALLIGAFIPAVSVGPGLQLQGLVLLALYLLGIFSAIAVATVIKLWRGSGPAAQLMMELPDYHWPRPSDVALGLWQRADIFLRSVGGIILALTAVLWLLSSFPVSPLGFSGSTIEYSLAGRIGKLLAVLFEPIGFNWQIAVALIPGLAAREVAVSALGTVYALSHTGDAVGAALTPIIASEWSLATGLSLLVWYVFAPQCMATLAAVRRELGGWRAPALMAVYLFGMAYAASWATYRIALNWSA
ncbi:MAG: ferrous iron transporter B [Betaproteobacteria bacterium]